MSAALPGVGISLPFVECPFGFFPTRRIDFVEGNVVGIRRPGEVFGAQLIDPASHKVRAVRDVLDVLIYEPFFESRQGFRLIVGRLA